jgi:hypothetical protein
MRRDVLFFAAGAVLTALAVNYSQATLLWDLIFWAGIAVMAASAVDFVARKFSGFKGYRMHPLVGSVIFGVLSLGCLSWYFWPTKLLPSDSVAATPVAPASKDKTFVECTLKTPLLFGESPLWMLQTFPLPIENGGGGLVQMSGPVGARVLPPNMPFVFQCDLTNYTSEPLFAVTLPLHLLFETAIDQGSGTKRNEGVFLERDWSITVPKIDIGPAGRFSFYVTNGSDKIVTVMFPKSATTGDGPLPQNIPLELAFNTTLHLSPVEDLGLK